MPQVLVGNEEHIRCLGYVNEVPKCKTGHYLRIGIDTLSSELLPD